MQVLDDEVQAAGHRRRRAGCTAHRGAAGAELPRQPGLDAAQVVAHLCLFELLANFLANFERPILGCIDADFCA